MRHGSLRRFSTVAFALAGLLGLASPARATAILTFSTGTAPAGGTVTITGANAVGANIPINLLSVTGAPANNGAYDLSGPAVAPVLDLNGSASLSFDTAAGTISIFGDVPALGILVSETLLSGTILGTTVTPGAATNLVISTGTDVKSANLLLALGLNPAQPFQFLDVEISLANLAATPGCVPSSNCGPVVSSLLSNVSVRQPFSLLLVGAGLMVFAVTMRMRGRRG